MDGRRAYRAAQTKDFSLQVSFYFCRYPKQPPKQKRNPVFSVRLFFFNTHLKYLPLPHMQPKPLLARSLSLCCVSVSVSVAVSLNPHTGIRVVLNKCRKRLVNKLFLFFFLPRVIKKGGRGYRASRVDWYAATAATEHRRQQEKKWIPFWYG